MIDFIISTTKLLFANFHNFVIEGLVVITLVIFIVGFFKKILFNKIKRKGLKGFVCAVSSLIVLLPATWGYLFTKNISLDYYWYAYTVLSVLTILVYWAYEHFGLRFGVHTLGNYTWQGIKSVFKKIFLKVLTDTNVDIEKELSESFKLTLNSSKEKAKKVISDKDLKNL